MLLLLPPVRLLPASVASVTGVWSLVQTALKRVASVFTRRIHFPNFSFMILTRALRSIFVRWITSTSSRMFTNLSINGTFQHFDRLRVPWTVGVRLCTAKGYPLPRRRVAHGVPQRVPPESAALARQRFAPPCDSVTAPVE